MPGLKTWGEQRVESLKGVWRRSPHLAPGAPWSGLSSVKQKVFWRLYIYRSGQISPLLDRPHLQKKNTGAASIPEKHPLAKMGWTCPPQSTPWQRPYIQPQNTHNMIPMCLRTCIPRQPALYGVFKHYIRLTASCQDSLGNYYYYYYY